MIFPPFEITENPVLQNFRFAGRRPKGLVPFAKKKRPLSCNRTKADRFCETTLLQHAITCVSHNGGVPPEPTGIAFRIQNAFSPELGSDFQKVLLAPGFHHPRFSVPLGAFLLSSSMLFLYVSSLLASITRFCGLCQPFGRDFTHFFLKEF